MPIYYHGNKIGTVYHMGNKISKIYHKGNLVFDGSGGSADSPIWDIVRYQEIVDFANNSAGYSISTVTYPSSVIETGSLVYPTLTMQGDILVFNPTISYIYYHDIVNNTWSSTHLPSGFITNMSRPVVANDGTVVFLVYTGNAVYFFTINTENKSLQYRACINNASITAAEVNAVKLFDTPQGIVGALVRNAGIGTIDIIRVSVVNAAQASIDVIASGNTAYTTDLSSIFLAPDSNIWIKHNNALAATTTYRRMMVSKFNILTGVLQSDTNAFVTSAIGSGVFGNVLFDNSSNLLIDANGISNNDINLLTVPLSGGVTTAYNASVISLYNSRRTAFHSWLVFGLGAGANRTPKLLSMSGYTLSESGFAVVPATQTNAFKNKVVVNAQGQIILYHSSAYQYTTPQSGELDMKTACSPWLTQ